MNYAHLGVSVLTLALSLFIAYRLQSLESRMSATSADVLAAVAADHVKLEALKGRIPAPVVPEDLTPVLDAVTALGAAIDAVDPTAPAAA